MTKVPRGDALILNNELFDDQNHDRPGSNVDVDNLTNLFGEDGLGFEV